jgi:hypothetical protein
MPEDEAVEIITRFVYRALNGKDFLPVDSPGAQSSAVL